MNDQGTVRLVIAALATGMIVGLLVCVFTKSEAAATVASTCVGALGSLLSSTRKEAP